MEIRHLYYIEEIAKCQSFTKAANALHTTQSNLSQQVKALEEELGFFIFVHSKRGLKLTNAGEAFLRSSQKVIESWENMLEESGKYSRNGRKNLVIAMYPAIKFTPVLDLISEYLKERDDIIPDIRVGSESDVITALYSGTCDIGFIEDAYLDELNTPQKKQFGSFVLTPVYDDSVGVVLHAKDRLACAAQIKKEQLKDYKIICKKDGSKLTFERIRKIFQEAGLDIGPPFALAEDPDVMISLVNEPGRVIFTNYSVGINLAQAHPDLRCIRLRTNKQVISYMVIRKGDVQIPRIYNLFRYIKERINFDG